MVINICISDIYCIMHLYRPQRSCGQGYVFTRVCDSVNRGEGGLWRTPPGPGRHPPGPGRHPPGPGTPPPGPGRHPPNQAHPRAQPPPRGPGRPPPPPPREEDCSIRSMSGRYASYWNAFLFTFQFAIMALRGLITMTTILNMVVVVTGSSLCELPPDWNSDGSSPMVTHSGNVTAVTLLQAS